MSRIGWERSEDRELPEEDVALRGRLYFFRLLIIAVLGLLIYRVYALQHSQGEALHALAEENRFARLLINPPRGVIYDRNGKPLAENLSSFNVTITPAFLPTDPQERQAVFERLSLLTGVPVTNTVEQQTLIATADQELISTYTRLAELFNAPIEETLDQADIVPRLPDSIAGIVETYSFAPYLPAVIKANIPITLAYTIEQESIFLPGVRVTTEPIRNYPGGEYMTHIIGYMGPLPNVSWLERGYQRDDRVGWYGLEISMEEELAGVKGHRQIEVDWTGREIRQIGPTIEPIAGHNLYLTIDLDLQIAVHEILERILELRVRTPSEFTGGPIETEQAAVVVLNPNTGEILALVSLPTFDNNRFATEVPVDYYLGLLRNDFRPLVNHAISGQYPPGSTFKIVTAAAAMQEGVISPHRQLFDPGEITIANRFAPNDPGRAQTFYCWKRDGHGFMNMYRALAESCNIYFNKITGGFDQDGEFIEGLGVDRLARYAREFGFGRAQGIELLWEAPGNMPEQFTAWKRRTQGEPWSTGDDYNIGMGQGFATSTPLQQAQMAAVIANGGFLYRPTLIQRITDENGTVVQGLQSQVLNAINVNREYIDVVAEGMYLVNQEGGTGASLRNFEWLDSYGITTAGKTGTSEFCDNIAARRGWCREGQIRPTHSWFVGYAPYERPEIAVAAFIYNGGEGSTWAAPVVRDVIAAYFKVGRYAPTEEAAPATEEAVEPIASPETSP